jgi:hypothetical protein
VLVATGPLRSSGLAFGSGGVLLVADGYDQLHVCDTRSGQKIVNVPY